MGPGPDPGLGREAQCPLTEVKCCPLLAMSQNCRELPGSCWGREGRESQGNRPSVPLVPGPRAEANEDGGGVPSLLLLLLTQPQPCYHVSIIEHLLCQVLRTSFLFWEPFKMLFPS